MVLISSTSALGNRGQTNYSAAKSGLQGMTKTLAIELGPFNVNVNCVAPGFIETDMTRQTAERIGVPFEQFADAVAKEVPLRRVGRPEDVAGTIAFLCSEDASYVSGQVVYVAGGPRG
jgi:3-oxoacyl-[acyl-carrier protein] reductase